jgi:hypothetical protein
MSQSYNRVVPLRPLKVYMVVEVTSTEDEVSGQSQDPNALLSGIQPPVSIEYAGWVPEWICKF